MKTETIILPVILFITGVITAELDHREIKCNVCKATLTEMDLAIGKIDKGKS
jgi:hypothetical protein